MFYKIYILINVVFLLLINTTVQGENGNYRQSKFWPATIVRFKNSICQTFEGFEGTCYRRKQCHDIGGTLSGSCANNLGSCCLFQRSCGGETSFNNTYFTNPGFPTIYDVSSSCSFTVHRCNPNICQIRLDFLNLNLGQPDGNGNCINDVLTISGGASNTPIICGENNGQHIYIDFNNDNDINLIISIGVLKNIGRLWNIKISQLSCDSPSMAPTGCLMYYPSLTGVVNSFNYGGQLSGELINNDIGVPGTPGTRQLSNENYGVCIQMLPGYCTIEWSQGPETTSFTLTGNTSSYDIIAGSPGEGIIGENCTTDFIVIPAPSFINGTRITGDRFCGSQFPTVISSSKPFVLTVVTDKDDSLPDTGNRGFSLNFRQLPCIGTNMIIQMI